MLKKVLVAVHAFAPEIFAICYAIGYGKRSGYDGSRGASTECNYQGY